MKKKIFIKPVKQIRIIVTLTLLLNLIFTKSAKAYIDPGTGSLMFQMLIAALIGGLFAIKKFWIKIRNLLYMILQKGKNEKIKR